MTAKLITFQITTGKVWIDSTLQPQTAYSGHGHGLDNPGDESVRAEGPTPEGLWSINPWESYHPHLGAWVSHLTPVSVPNTYGRSAFFIHGDNAQMNHTASDGCIIMDATLRGAVRQSGATLIKVIR